MRVSDIRNSVLISVTDMSAGDSGYLDRGFESDLRKHIRILVFEDDLDSSISHEFLGVCLHLLILNENIKRDIFYIIIEIRDGDLVIDIIEFGKYLVHLMDGIGDYSAIES